MFITNVGIRIKFTFGTVKWAVALLLTALIVALHGTGLSHAGGLWRDEANTMSVATLPSLGQLWHTLKFEAFPLLPFVALRGWAAMVGADNDFGLRVFGFLAGVSVLGALWFNARVILRTPPFWSLVLIGFNVVLIRSGDSLRAYGLGMLFILLTFGAIWRVVESATPGRIVVAMLAGILSVQTLYSNAFLLAAIGGAGALVYAADRVWKKSALMLALGIPAALSLLPYLGIIRQTALIDRPVRMPFSWATAWPMLSSALGSPAPFLVWLWLGLGAIGFLGGLYLLVFAQTLPAKQKRRALFGWAAVFGSTVASAIFFILAGVRPSPWYYITTMAVWAVSLEVIFSVLFEMCGSLSRPAWRWITTGSQVFLPLALAIYLFFPAHQMLLLLQTNMDGTARQLQTAAAKEDFIIANPWYYGVSFARYYHGPTSWQTLPPLADHSIHRYDFFWNEMTGQPAESLRRVTDKITETLRANHRVWVVGDLTRLGPGEMPPELKPAPTDDATWKNGHDVDAFYEYAWTVNLSHFLDTHAREGVQLLLPPEQQRVYFEAPSVIRFEGWRDQ